MEKFEKQLVFDDYLSMIGNELEVIRRMVNTIAKRHQLYTDWTYVVTKEMILHTQEDLKNLEKNLIELKDMYESND